MKLSTVVFAAATVATTSAAMCDTNKLTPLLMDSNVRTCSTDSGFSIVAPVVPTGDARNKFCSSAACQTALTMVKALGLGDCTVLNYRLQTDVLTPLTNACASGANNSTSNNSTSNNSTAGNSTKRNSSSKSSSSSGSKASNSKTTAPPNSILPTLTPSPTSTAGSSNPSNSNTPAPTTSAAASVGVTAASVAIAVAFAAAFM